MVHMRSEVRIAEFKSQLSRYLRAAQAGSEIVIKDRDTPVARLVPYTPPARRLETRPPVGSLKDLDTMRRPPRPKNLKLKDLEAALREERRDRFL
jgi:prevent-host-death family protein